jgi:hypothetical protein
MGFRCLTKSFVIVAVILWLPVFVGAADAYQSEASATIQATATVVPSLGFINPDGTPTVSTGVGADVLGAYVPLDESARHDDNDRLLMRYPSGSVLLIVGNDIDDGAAIDLSELDRYVEAGRIDRSSLPGAAILNLHRLSADHAAGDTSLTLTLIYTEN